MKHPKPLRRPILATALLAATTLACAPEATTRTDAAALADDAAERSADEASALVDDYLERYFAFYPSRATSAGLHTHDLELEHPTPERVAGWVAFNRAVAARAEEALAAAPAAFPDRPGLLDLELLGRQARREIFRYETVRAPETSPLFWTGIASNAHVMLLVRDDLPPEQRLAAAVARARLVPRLTDLARRSLEAADPAQIVPAHASLAGRQAAASATFYRQGFARAVEQAAESADDDPGQALPSGDAAALRASMERAGAAAAEALEELASFLAGLEERAAGSPRLGPERYAELFHLYTGVERPVADVLADAEAALTAKRAEAAAYGRRVWAEVMPADEKPPADDRELLRRLFDRVARDRAATAEELTADYETLVAEAFAFTREHDVMTLPERRTLWIGRSPSYFIGQSVGGVYPAGPYAPEADTLFYLPAPPPDASPEAKDAFFRDFNHHFNVMITPHEMVPGHYLQLKLAARHPHKVRALFSDGVYTEGWGTFSERLMLDLGWGGPLDRLAHLKKQLENIARTVVDIRVHTGGMERDEVLRFVRQDALQDDQFAGNMWMRSITSAPQLTSYWLGYRQVMGLYEDVRAARGERFALKEFMDGMMELGPVPVRHYRARMLGD